MLEITCVAGNIFDGNIEDAGFERLKLSRAELQKNRIRRSTDGGTDVGLALEPGRALRNGDILTDGKKKIIVEQIPEKVIAIRLKDPSPDLGVLAGHIIGNRHRPVSIQDGTVMFPVQADSELETFEKLFSSMAGSIEMEVKETVFNPHLAMNVHDHG